MKQAKRYFLQSEKVLRVRQRALVRGFMINSALASVTAAAIFFLDAGPAVARALGARGGDAYVAHGRVAWGVGGFVIFLIPALATYWARGAGQDFTGKCEKIRYNSACNRDPVMGSNKPLTEPPAQA